MASERPVYTLVIATKADIPKIIDIIEDAFADDPITPHLRGTTDPKEFLERRAKMHSAMLEHSHLTGSRYILAVDKTSGKAVGVAEWEFPVRLTDSQKAEKEAVFKELFSLPPLQGSNRSLRRAFLGSTEAMKEKYCDPERDIYLSMLGVRPSHTRRGIGSLLLRDGIEHADRLGANVFLMSSVAGMPLYLHQGWQLLDDRWVLDMAEHGAPAAGKITHECLIRKPRHT